MSTEKRRGKILFVHETPELCAFVSNTLGHQGFDTILVSSVDEAKEKILNDCFSFILSETHLTDGCGHDVLNFARKISATPLILLSGGQEAKEDQGHEFLNFVSLPKPFREKDLLAVLDKIINDKESHIVLMGAEYVKSEECFTPINIEEFISGKEIKYDIFINIGGTKFVKLSNGNEYPSDEQIQRLKRKGVTSLYMRKKDFIEYISMTVNLVKSMKKVKISADRKFLFLEQTTKMLMESMILKHLDGEAVGHAKAVVDSTINMLTGSDEILLSLELMKNDRRNVFAHSLNVALYSVLIARNLNWNSYTTLTKLAAGGMFHDIGKTKVPPEILGIPQADLIQSEKEMFKRHVSLGVEIMREIEGLPEEIILIVQQHHEHESGSGYPAGIKRNLIHPLSKVIRVADEFCEIMSNRSPTLPHIVDTIRMLETDKGHSFHADSVNALKLSFKKRMAKAS